MKKIFGYILLKSSYHWGEGDFFYHACDNTDDPKHFMNGGLLDEKYAINGGVWLTKKPGWSITAATEFHLNPRNAVVVKVFINKRYLKYVEQDIEPMSGSESARQEHLFDCIPTKYFKNFNEGIKKGYVVFEH